ncbi:nicotinamide phosphoribosyltransferase [Mucilaginibacter lappiensis]|uniref:Nicotinamide phosphoribosyltransferase n=1 Tax=Mucilaginibacter lappiensis TaxID=354630 RepID=A0ABR6PHA8_9SPHI|nr:nicotinate phosphoribosyltransferase [Mucilaginibacter lappiensis]MBB6108988.1 nicotinamide phosphoribosyltransferase [Mucilaginibacter lappiensis]SIQ70717.1 nicotinamide phosphoribosyltransferase [Mucilaginibacter lappiensis]
MKRENLILLADAYKYAHHKFYYPGTTQIYSYLESRGGLFDETIFFGLQYFLKEYIQGQAFTQQDIDEADGFLQQVFGRDDVFNRAKFQYILDKYNGHLPIKIKAIAEGTAVPTGNVLMTIENTDPECYWLTNFLETLLMQVWYPCTVATLSNQIRKVITQYFQETATDGAEAGIDFVLNDFGFRGVSSVESAKLGGAAHLINFSGSDNLAGSSMAITYYDAQKVYGLSIPATEHSICTLLGKEGELEVFRHVLKSFPTGTIACVSDSYNIFRACEEYWGTELRDEILNRKGTLVIRPDSGDPIRTLLEIFEILFSKFGYTVNAKGYKVLPPQLRVIQGDGVNYNEIKNIYKTLKENSISAENLVLGMGGALLQKVDRDTQKFALKCSSAVINGREVAVEKSPTEMDAQGNITESFKKSKAGRLKLVKINGIFKTVKEQDYTELSDHLQIVFENGQLTNIISFEQVRANAN